MNETHGPASPLPEGRADGRAEVLHWSHYEDDECIEDCPGCLREKVIEAAAQAEDGNYGNIGGDEATSLVDRMLAAVAAAPDPLAAPVVAVPEAGERACDCPTNEAGDIRCHVCREYVNKRCWNCHTPRGEGPCPNPAPVVGEREEKP